VNLRTNFSSLLAISFSLVVTAKAFSLPGTGIGLFGDVRPLDISANTEINAIRGSLGQFKLVSEDGKLAVVDGKGFPYLSKTTKFSQTDAADAEFYALQYLSILKAAFSRDGLDGHQGPLILQVGLTYPDLSANPCNGKISDFDAVPMASFSAEKSTAYFSIKTQWTEAFGSSVTIVSYELTHGITATTSHLTMIGESGALNEAFSDIMAMYMSKRIAPKRFSWIMGREVQRDVRCSGMRYLSQPNTGVFWVQDATHSTAAKEIVRDHYSQLYRGSADSGGAHINSGIPALAFYLLSEGGSHPRKNQLPRVDVNGIGMERAMQIFYRGFTHYLKTDSQMKDARDATLQAARDIDPDAISSVQDAWTAVGL
jgi:Zn-dependent metalloprotease